MKIGIIGAMPEEMAMLNSKIKVENFEKIANQHYTTGSYANHEIILLQAGIGKVNAAIGTALMLEKYKPDYLINIGSAGGFSAKLKVSDIIVSTEVGYYDVDVTAFGYVYGQVPKLPPRFRADPKLVQLVLDASKEMASTLKGVLINQGFIVTGDVFIETKEQRAIIMNKFKDVCACEMEAAAIAQVAHQFNVPFVVIRALSDIAGDNSGVSFSKYLEKAAHNSALLTLKTIEKIKTAG